MDKNRKKLTVRRPWGPAGGESQDSAPSCFFEKKQNQTERKNISNINIPNINKNFVVSFHSQILQVVFRNYFTMNPLLKNLFEVPQNCQTVSSTTATHLFKYFCHDLLFGRSYLQATNLPTY
jgi:hypothetical protein